MLTVHMSIIIISSADVRFLRSANCNHCLLNSRGFLADIRVHYRKLHFANTNLYIIYIVKIITFLLSIIIIYDRLSIAKALVNLY